MIPHVLCDWTTLRATSSTTQFLQSEESWLRLWGFRDLTAWIHVSEATSLAGVRVELQTAPTSDSALFETLSATSVGTGGVYVAVSRANVAIVPLSHILRWRVTRTGAVTWSVTFRIVLALNPVVPGARLAQDSAVEGRDARANESLRSPTPAHLRERRMAYADLARRR